MENAAKSCWLGLLIAAVALPNYAATQIVVPNDLATTDGNGANLAPFGLGKAGFASVRYQQVYDASQFSPISLGGEWITRLWFRVDTTNGNGFSSTLTNIQINLSLAVKAPDGLSTNFVENQGVDGTVVFGPGVLSIGSGFSPFMSPQAFEVRIDLANPFLYDSMKGNLLLDVKNFLREGAFPFLTEAFDAADMLGDSISRVWSTNVASMTGRLDTIGLVTRFEFWPTPGLTAQATNNSVVVSWPAYPQSFVLQGANQLIPQPVWQSVTNGINTNDFSNWYAIPLSSSGPER